MTDVYNADKVDEKKIMMSIFNTDSKEKRLNVINVYVNFIKISGKLFNFFFLHTMRSDHIYRLILTINPKNMTMHMTGKVNIYFSCVKRILKYQA